MKSKILFYSLILLALLLLSVGAGLFIFRYFNSDQPISLSFNQAQPTPTPLPFLKYTIENLKNYPFMASDITIEDQLNTNIEDIDFNSYVFSYLSQGKKITGQLNIPSGKIKGIIVMIRGYVPLEIYQTGVGTKNAASVLAQNGYITFAPDFLGFGGSDAESKDSWESRFVKPINVIELIKSIEELSSRSARQIEGTRSGIQVESLMNDEILKLVQDDMARSSSLDLGSYQFDANQIGLWAHSNGGQVALTVLEILSEPIPTTLWAPVTVPFPYSVMFYSDEMEDEGKATRKWVSLFENDYDVFDFSLTKHLNLLTGPIQIHQGIVDDAAPVAWNDEFADKIKLENTRREDLAKTLKTTTDSAVINQINSQILDPIDFTYHRYPGTDHNLQPVWNQVIATDIEFYNTFLK